MDYIKIVEESKSRSEVCKKLGWYPNGRGMKKVKEIIEKYDIDTSHFGRKTKLKRDNKECPVCGNGFETIIGHKKEKTTCSRKCSNTYFRSGSNHGNYKNINDYDQRTNSLIIKYRELYFEYREHKCCICDENKILDVHHLDGNYLNNDIENLIPICPTHHRYLHSKHKDDIIDELNEYLKRLEN